MFLTVVFWLFALGSLHQDLGRSELISLWIMAVMWPALAYICHLKIQWLRCELSKNPTG